MSTNISNGRKIDQMIIKLPRFSIATPPKFTQIGIFGLTTNHLATLVQRVENLKNLFVMKIPNFKRITY
jgi:hypothetical protein